MRLRNAVLAIAAGATGAALAGAAAGVAHQRRVIAHRDAGERVAFGSLRSPALTVVADDGVPLHVEVDEPAPRVDGATAPAPTVVFVHGYALNLDCWHFQRAAYRGQLRTVLYDQRSHGRSGRSTEEHATIEQLGSDLARVLEEVVPEGPVVLVGHSMGGMSVIALAESHPELFGDRVVGVALISTTAGGLEPHRVLVPMVPRTLGGQVAVRVVAALARGHRVVEGFRRIGRPLALVATDQFAFGSDVPERYVAFVDEMLSRTPFDVLADFFPAFGGLDKFALLDALGTVPTTIACGTKDRITAIGHSRKLHAHIEGSRLEEFEDAGHMVIMERHAAVNELLDDLIEAAVA
ncbi:alpha/beta hydrolase [Nocardioides zeae]|uniref:Alpha/beta hydrolase n=1 Tax=Nocardioides imazamoxiresistens TaxID=3231893 RepID=A0ABU3PR85_9ACTN|nr:alpha/beta hydrolase [Nocardioides zeae]MDT9591739.1 alpha/beta hydrolase [Nocardioides zeae]